MVSNFSGFLTDSQLSRAKSSIENLTNGASAFQLNDLQVCSVENAKITQKYGKEITDSIGYWIQEGFACGPFDYPPVDRFRVNSLLAVPQEGKVRPVLNVSLPDGHSFNDNIDINLMEKVHMSSAREFGYLIMKCGRNALMSKFDLKDAYKNIPAKINDLRLQGFKWLNKFFIDISQIFGARSAVSNFDTTNHTITDLAVIVSETLPELVLRHLDDVPTVGPADKQYCQNFSREYMNICIELNLKLAQNCPNNEKAFCNDTYGKVLGYWFDTEKLCWRLPENKRSETLELIDNALKNDFLTIKAVQKLVGKLNSACLLCPFMSIFKRNLNVCISKTVNTNYDSVRISPEAKKDLKVWVGFLTDPEDWIPIPTMPCSPPINHKVFTSDAGGLSNNHKDSGVASFGVNEENEVIFCVQFIWNQKMLTSPHPDGSGVIGENSLFLEFVGVILPFILVPEQVQNQHIVCLVDNTGCYSGWLRKNVKNDVLTSILIRALVLIASYCECIVHIDHLPRMSTSTARMVDRMSRIHTTSRGDSSLLQS